MDRELEEKKSNESFVAKIQRIFRMGCLLIFLMIFGVIILMVSRPKFFWNPLVDFLNSGITLDNDTEYSIEEAKRDLNTQLETNNSITEVVLTEEILNTIARTQVPELPNLTFEFEENIINVYWQLNEREGTELLGFVQLVPQDDQDSDKVFTDLKINKIGVPRLTVPRILHRPLFSSVRKIFEFKGESTGNESLLFKFLGSSSIFEITELRIEKDQLVLLLDTNNSFYD